MAANDYSKYNDNVDPLAYQPKYKGLPKEGEPIPDDWFDAGRRRRINEFRRILPA